MQTLEENMVFLGLAAEDPPTVRYVAMQMSPSQYSIMVTGDYGLTALSIARKSELQGDARVASGLELAGHGDDQLS